MLGSNIPTPPDNIGPRSTPNYAALASAAVTNLSGGIKVFAGQRDDPFFVDLGSIFDLAGLRPFNPLHLLPLTATAGRGRAAGLQHALDRPAACRSRSSCRLPSTTVGIYASASREQTTVLRAGRDEGRTRPVGAGLAPREPADQRGRHPAGRQGLLEPRGSGRTTASSRTTTRRPRSRTSRTCSTALPRPVTPAARWRRSPRPGAPISSLILLTGVPGLNFTGTTQADLLRLNTAIKPGANGPAPAARPARRRPTGWASSPATSAASRTGGGSRTTSSTSSCGRSRRATARS